MVASSASTPDEPPDRRRRERPSHDASHDSSRGSPLPPTSVVVPEAERVAALEATYHGTILPVVEDVIVGALGCQRCELLPEPLHGPGTLSFRCPHSHTLGKMLRALRESGLAHDEQRGIVTVAVPTDDLRPVVERLADVLTSVEQRDVRVRFQAHDHLTGADDYFTAEPLPRFSAMARGGWLVRLMRGRELRSVFQPIVDARAVDGRYRVHGYECLMRGVRDGHEVSPAPMLDLARAADLLFQLDLAARRTALLAAARHAVRERVFVNFTPHAVYEPRTCLRSTVALVDELGLRRDQVVFEVVETERFDDLTHLARVVGYYRDEGFAVALDDVGAGYASLNALLAVRPDYVKLDMALIRDVDRDASRAVVARKMLEAARELGRRTVVEGVETAGECEWATEHGADYMQGFYFARPAAPPPPVREAA